MTETKTLDPSVQYVKIHGLQRSGTNYLTYLVNENFENTKVLVNIGGWKHGHYMVPWAIGAEVHVLIVVKDPYSWLVSLYDYWGPSRKRRVGPDLTGVPFEDFVRNRVYFEKQKDVPYLYRASNPIQHWNNMNFHWTTIRCKSLFVVTYESLLDKKEKCLEQIGKAFTLAKKPELKDCKQVLEPAGETLKESEEHWNRHDYYKNWDYLNMYTPETLAFVNDELDLDLMVGLGYQYR